MNTEFDKIKKISGSNPNECSCNTCVSMCKTAPCMGTPDDILRLINNGHGDKLEVTLFAAGLPDGIPPINYVQPLFIKEESRCAFLINDRCQLHNSGLKPTEGKLANCKKTHLKEGEIFLPYAIIATWIQSYNTKTVRLIVSALEKRNKNL